MINEGSITNDPGRQTRIEKAVEKETRRRKRLLILYSLFLVIPFGMGVGFLMYGHSDREILKTELDRRLAPVEAAVEQAEPALQQVRDMAVRVSAQEERLDRLSREQEPLLKLTTPNYAQLSLNQRFETELASIRNLLTQQDKLLSALVNDQNKIKNEQTRIDSELKRLADRVSAVRPTSYDEILQEHARLLERMQNELRSLTKRKVDRQSNSQISSK